jgi:type IV secretory pathway TraG/TraD family ATPase VirD4
MREQLKWASDPAMVRILKTPEKPWRFNQLKDELGTIYIGVSAKFSTIAHKLNRWFMGCAAMEMQSTPPGRYRACLVADEFPMMGKVEIFQTICAEGAGHGFTVWPIVQNCGQLIETYGQEGYRNILSACEIQMFLTPRDPDTASEIERLAGDKTILTCSFSYGGRKRNDWDGMSIGEAGAKVLDAHSVMGLASDRMIIVAPGLVPDVIIAQRKPYWTYPDINHWCDPNPYAPASEKRQTKPVSAKAPVQGSLVERLARELEQAAQKK